MRNEASETGAVSSEIELRGRVVGDLALERERRFAVEAELRERERQLRSILASVGDAVIVGDAEGCVAFMNAVAEVLTGWTEDDAKGRPLAEVFQCTERGVLAARHGARTLIEDSTTPGDNGGAGAGRILVFREITARAWAERERLLREERAARLFAERSVTRVTQLQALISALSWSPRLADVVDAALAYVPAALGAAGAVLFMYGLGRATLEPVGHVGGDDSLIDTFRAVPVDGDRLVAVVARTGEARWVDGPEDLAHVQADLAVRLRSAGIQALAALPLHVDGRTLGVLAMGFPGRRKLSPSERSFVLTAAEQCAQALDRALAHARAERAADRTARLQEVTAAFSEARTPTDVAAAGITQGCSALGAPRGLVGLLTEDGTALEMVQILDYPPEVAAAMRLVPTALDAPLTDVVRSGEALFFETAGALTARYPHLADQWYPGDNSLAVIPLAVRGRMLGSMAIVFDEPRVLDEDDRTFLQALGRQCAQALDRARLYEAAARARFAAEAANRAKDEFLSILSHELRTPLTAILGWADILRTRRPEPVALERALRIIERNAKALVQLIEDILDVSRIVTGKLRLDLRAVDPAAAVRAAVDVVRPQADAKGIVIEAALDDSDPLAADPQRLQQIVWNLLSNAVKFSPQQSRIDVRLKRSNAERGCVELQVIDAGTGIEPAFLPHVFERFRQADGSSTRSTGGLGLGLAIVKHLVELHEGTITAESAGAGRGATFTVTLPTRPRLAGQIARDGGAEPATQPATRQRLDGVRVVIVDDEPDARDLVATILRGQGAQVTVAASAQEALTAIKLEVPDVFVSDIGMPDEDGYALLEKIRLLTADLPALALTAYAGVEDARMAVVAGFQRHLAKPVAPAHLVDAVARLAGRVPR